MYMAWKQEVSLNEYCCANFSLPIQENECKARYEERKIIRMIKKVLICFDTAIFCAVHTQSLLYSISWLQKVFKRKKHFSFKANNRHTVWYLFFLNEKQDRGNHKSCCMNGGWEKEYFCDAVAFLLLLYMSLRDRNVNESNNFRDC